MNRYVSAAVLLCFAAAAFGQSSNEHVEPPKVQKFYKLLVSVDQFEGTKPIKSQEVSVTVPLGQRNSTHIRSGEKIPYNDQAQQYQDVGLNVDIRDLEELASDISLSLQIQLSTAVGIESGKLPLIRQYSWDSTVLVPVGRPVTVYSDSSSNSQYKMEVKITAKPLDLH